MSYMYFKGIQINRSNKKLVPSRKASILSCPIVELSNLFMGAAYSRQRYDKCQSACLNNVKLYGVAWSMNIIRISGMQKR